jgi:hypothetical protein
VLFSACTGISHTSHAEISEGLRFPCWAVNRRCIICKLNSVLTRKGWNANLLNESRVQLSTQLWDLNCWSIWCHWLFFIDEEIPLWLMSVPVHTLTTWLWHAWLSCVDFLYTRFTCPSQDMWNVASLKNIVLSSNCLFLSAVVSIFFRKLCIWCLSFCLILC